MDVRALTSGHDESAVKLERAIAHLDNCFIYDGLDVETYLALRSQLSARLVLAYWPMWLRHEKGSGLAYQEL